MVSYNNTGKIFKTYLFIFTFDIVSRMPMNRYSNTHSFWIGASEKKSESEIIKLIHSMNGLYKNSDIYN